MITPQKSIDIVHRLLKDGIMDEATVKMAAKTLNDSALNEWKRNNKKADNILVIFVSIKNLPSK